MLNPSSRTIWRSICLVLALTTGMAGTVLAQAPASSPEIAVEVPEGPLGEQIAWVVDAANGDVSLTNPVEIISHFDAAYLQFMGIDGLIDFAYGLVRTWAPVTLESIDVSDDGTTGTAVLTARDGTLLDLTVQIDPESGLIADVLVEPALSASPAASPIASPAASQPVPSYADIEQDYTAGSDAASATGKESVAEFLNGNFESLAARFNPELQSQVTTESFATALTVLTTDRVHFEYPEVGVVFDGHLKDGSIDGFFFQGTPGTFSLRAESAQSFDGPSGTWSGSIIEFDLEISVTFVNEAGSLSATLDIPSQDLADQPLGNVAYEEERPIGDMLDERTLLLGEGTNGYRAAYEWGPGYLVLDVYQMSDGTLSGFLPSVQWPLPQVDTLAPIAVNAPFEGAWLTIWGGNSEFLNYHAVSPQQRYALDLAVWQNGASFAGNGLEVEDYHAYGQSLYAPVAGEVVSVESALPDMPSALAQQVDPAVAEAAAAQAAEQTPVGNHVVLQIEDGLFVFLAHMMPGTATVAVGDTVTVSELLGRVGNSGNTSEPHIHLHVQTSPDLLDPAAAGVPIVWNAVAVNGQSSGDASPEQSDIVEAAG
ncbi:MAG: Cpe/LpqF family protein [Thermomicrobiales bacterium]